MGKIALLPPRSGGIYAFASQAKTGSQAPGSYLGLSYVPLLDTFCALY